MRFNSNSDRRDETCPQRLFAVPSDVSMLFQAHVSAHRLQVAA